MCNTLESHVCECVCDSLFKLLIHVKMTPGRIFSAFDETYFQDSGFEDVSDLVAET